MSTSYEAHVTGLMEQFARAADVGDFGEVDEVGTRWAIVPLMGIGNVFDIARERALRDMELAE